MPATRRRSAARVTGTSITTLSGSTDTPSPIAASQAADSASPARSHHSGSSPPP
jgi:hypothetical protein